FHTQAANENGAEAPQSGDESPHNRANEKLDFPRVAGNHRRKSAYGRLRLEPLVPGTWLRENVRVRTPRVVAGTRRRIAPLVFKPPVDRTRISEYIHLQRNAAV